MHFPINKSTKNSSQNCHSRPMCRESADSEMQCLHLVHTLSRHSSFLHGGGGGGVRKIAQGLRRWIGGHFHWKICQSVYDLPCTTHSFHGNLWSLLCPFFGKLLGASLSIYGKLVSAFLSILWETCGRCSVHSMGNMWSLLCPLFGKLVGASLSILWETCRRSLSILWEICGCCFVHSMGNLWALLCPF
jgi:hypothetical protein